jgi:hypothetical protein
MLQAASAMEVGVRMSFMALDLVGNRGPYH